MIKPQHFVALALAALASVLLSFGLYATTYRFNSGKVEGTLLLPELSRQGERIASIELRQGEKKITLQRTGFDWRIAEREGYPANPDRVRNLLNALRQVELVEPRTAVKDKWKLLELEDPAGKDAKSRSVRVLDAKGVALGELVVGKARPDAFGPGKGGVYVRRPAETQTWLAMGDPKGGLDLKDWVALTAFDFDTNTISKIIIEHPGEAPIVVEKGDGKEAKFKLAQAIPEGMKLKQGFSVDQVGGGFAAIELEDVRRLAATPVGDKVSIIKLEADGGMLVTFRLRKEGEASWLSFSAAGDGEAVKKKVETINARAVGWEYKIPQWKVDQIGRRMADMVEKVEEKK
ncbi:MAG: DUF4340 domain-containing protein [Hyphomicrobiaceae bacterium]